MTHLGTQEEEGWTHTLTWKVIQVSKEGKLAVSSVSAHTEARTSKLMIKQGGIWDLEPAILVKGKSVLPQDNISIGESPAGPHHRPQAVHLHTLSNL